VRARRAGPLAFRGEAVPHGAAGAVEALDQAAPDHAGRQLPHRLVDGR
jgi:hypothetical protein